MADTGLPNGWEVRHSRSRNLPYYFEPVTGQSMWEPPQGTNTVALAQFMAENHSEQPAQVKLDNQQQQPKVRASHLLVKHKDSRRPSSWKESNITRSKEEAFEILSDYKRRIESGQTTLAQLATTESDCGSARRGGDLGYFGPNEMQKEFETVAFNLQPGEMSDIVETASGLHLILRTA